MQISFRKEKYSVDALISLTEKLKLNCRNEVMSAVVFSDLTKAFISKSHDVFLRKRFNTWVSQKRL